MNVILRIAALLFGMAVFFDSVLPLQHETVTVDSHSQFVNEDKYRQSTSKNFTDIEYSLYFLSSKARSCNVGYDAFRRIKDGDEVDVTYTKLLKRCATVAPTGERPPSPEKLYRLMGAVFGLVAILGGLGIIKSFEFFGKRLD